MTFKSPSSTLRHFKITKKVDASELLIILGNKRRTVERIRFIPPILGKTNDFGSFSVEFEHGITSK
jgi:hypothetical protein